MELSKAIESAALAACGTLARGNRAGAGLRMALPVLAALLAIGSGTAMADEVAVSGSAMQDIEFDHDHAMFEWVDVNHRLWAGAVDTTTGALIPSSGMGTLIDKYCTTSSTFGNGPEYVQSSSGYSIVYNKYIPSTTQDNSKDPTKTYVAKATLSGSTWTTNGAAWQGTTLGFVEPEGNLNPAQSNPPFVFHDGTNADSPLYIMGINDSQPVAVPNTNSASTLGSARFVTGLNELIYTAPVTVNGSTVRQAFSYNVSTGVTTQLTFDATNKGDMFIFQSPEYKNGYVMMLSINGQYINFYTYQYNSTTHTSSWQVVQSITPPQGAKAPPYIISPEPFTYKNKTYVYMVRSTSRNSTTLTIPTEVWVASFDGSYYARVSNSATADPAVRSDPKYYVTTSGIYIYYLRYSVATSTKPSQPQGVRRSNSGIPL